MSAVASQQQGLVFSTPGCGRAFLSGVCMLSWGSAWVFTRYSGVLPLSKDMKVRWTGISKSPTIGMTVSVNLC